MARNKLQVGIQLNKTGKYLSKLTAILCSMWQLINRF